jgi:hypothetical protein
MFILNRGMTQNQHNFSRVLLPKIASQFAKFNEFNTIIQLKNIIFWDVTPCGALKVKPT